MIAFNGFSALGDLSASTVAFRSFAGFGVGFVASTRASCPAVAGFSLSRGFGVVEMADNAAAQAAIEALNGKEVDGRNLKVNEAQPKTERSGGGGGRGR